MEENQKIIAYFLEGHNISEVAAYFHKARKTVNLILELVTNPNSPYYQKEEAEKIRLMKEKLILEARRKAGKTSKREIVIKDDVALEIVQKILNQGLSLRELSNEYNCSHTTISNAIKRVVTQEELARIKEIYKENEVKGWRR